MAEPGEPDPELLGNARSQGRTLFTRDRALQAAAPQIVRLLAEVGTREQLSRVLSLFGTPPQEQWFSRCVGRGRTYWRGSHYERARNYLESLPRAAGLP